MLYSGAFCEKQFDDQLASERNLDLNEDMSAYRRNVRVGSCSFLILINASSNIGPHLRVIFHVQSKLALHLGNDALIHIDGIGGQIRLLVWHVRVPAVDFEELDIFRLHKNSVEGVSHAFTSYAQQGQQP